MAAPKSYVWNPTDYAKHSTNQFVWAKELIPKLELKGNEDLLDIGCGDGKITAEIAKCLPDGRVLGVDNSAAMVELTKKSFPAQENPNLRFEVADARRLPFREEFDRVFSNATLHWVKDQNAVLQSVKRSLKPSGKLLFQMGGRGNAKAVLGILDTMLLEDKWRDFFVGFKFPYAFLTDKEYIALLIEAGLTPKRVELIPKVMQLTGAEGLAGWIRTTWLPYTERLPPELRDSFVGEIVERYLTDHPADAGVVFLDMVRLEVEAIKP